MTATQLKEPKYLIMINDKHLLALWRAGKDQEKTFNAISAWGLEMDSLGLCSKIGDIIMDMLGMPIDNWKSDSGPDGGGKYFCRDSWSNKLFDVKTDKQFLGWVKIVRKDAAIWRVKFPHLCGN